MILVAGGSGGVKLRCNFRDGRYHAIEGINHCSTVSILECILWFMAPYFLDYCGGVGGGLDGIS